MGAHLTIDFAHVIGVFFVMRNARQSFGSFVFAVRGVVHASWSSSLSHVRRLALSMSWSSLSAGQGIKRRMFDSIRCACAQGVVDLVKKVCFIGFVLADLASSYRGEHTWHGHHTPQECLG